MLIQSRLELVLIQSRLELALIQSRLELVLIQSRLELVLIQSRRYDGSQNSAPPPRALIKQAPQKASLRPCQRERPPLREARRVRSVEHRAFNRWRRMRLITRVGAVRVGLIRTGARLRQQAGKQARKQGTVPAPAAPKTGQTTVWSGR